MTAYSDDVALEICTRLAEGESLRSICRSEGMPSQRAVFNWITSRPEFRAQYEQARDLQADTFVDELLDIADDGQNDWMERLDEKGKSAGWTLNGEHVQRSKLRLDARKWVASKLKPKKYGDKVETTLTGANGGPVQLQVGRIKLVRPGG